MDTKQTPPSLPLTMLQAVRKYSYFYVPLWLSPIYFWFFCTEIRDPSPWQGLLFAGLPMGVPFLLSNIPYFRRELQWWQAQVLTTGVWFAILTLCVFIKLLLKPSLLVSP